MANFGMYSNKHVQFYHGEVPKFLDRVTNSFGWYSFLDLGCGDGALLSAMKERGYLDGKDVYAMDLSPERIARVEKIDPGFTCIVGDAMEIPKLGDGSIDFVCASNVIEHVNDDIKMIGAVRRVLKNRGKVYISTTFKKWCGWYFYRNSGQWVLDPTHVREYKKDSQLYSKLETAGFRIEHSKKSVSKYPAAELILRKLGFSNSIFNNTFLRFLRNFKVPIIGYYKWEILCSKQ